MCIKVITHSGKWWNVSKGLWGPGERRGLAMSEEDGYQRKHAGRSGGRGGGRYLAQFYQISPYPLTAVLRKDINPG